MTLNYVKPRVEYKSEIVRISRTLLTSLRPLLPYGWFLSFHVEEVEWQTDA